MIKDKQISKCKFCGKEEKESLGTITSFNEKKCECGNNKFWIKEVIA
jgi:hypothetical protein